MGNYPLGFPSSHTDSTCNRRRCSLYLPVQDLLGMAVEHKGIIHPAQQLAFPYPEVLHPSFPNPLVPVKTRREASPKEPLPSFEDLEDHTNLLAFDNDVKDGECEQARHSEPWITRYLAHLNGQ